MHCSSQHSLMRLLLILEPERQHNLSDRIHQLGQLLQVSVQSYFIVASCSSGPVEMWESVF